MSIIIKYFIQKFNNILHHLTFPNTLRFENADLNAKKYKNVNRKTRKNHLIYT